MFQTNEHEIFNFGFLIFEFALGIVAAMTNEDTTPTSQHAHYMELFLSYFNEFL